MTRPLRTLRAVPCLLVAAWLAACGRSGPTGPSSTSVASIVVSASGSTTIPVGGTLQLQASPRNSAGQPIAGVQVAWLSQHPGVATVSTTGLVTGVGVGSALITASGGGRSGQITVTVTDPSPPAGLLQITTTILSNGTIGVPYTQALSATGGDGSPPTWVVSAGALPPGLSLAAATGVISGTPTAAGAFAFTVRLTIGGEMDEQPLSITVIGANPVTIDNWYLRVGAVGVAYPGGVRIIASAGNEVNFAFQVTAGALPTGLVLHPTTGEISGTPTAPGTAFFEVRVSSSGQEASRIFALSVSTRPYSGFNIAILNASGTMPTVDVRAALDVAVAKWESAITTNLPPLVLPTPTGLNPTSCQAHAPKLRSGDVVEDVVILTAIAPIDGVGGTVARAGPCGYVAPGNLIWMGSLTFDDADLATLDPDRIASTITHEIGHVVGIGTLWTQLGNTLLTGEGGADPQYTGAAGMAAYTALGGGGFIPVENTGGSGTRDSHWRESVFDNELMTGFLEAAGVPMPLSIMSIRSLVDLGWTVDVGAADPYALPAPGLRAEVGSSRVPLGNDTAIEPLYRIHADGRVELLGIPR